MDIQKYLSINTQVRLRTSFKSIGYVWNKGSRNKMILTIDDINDAISLANSQELTLSINIKIKFFKSVIGSVLGLDDIYSARDRKHKLSLSSEELEKSKSYFSVLRKKNPLKFRTIRRLGKGDMVKGYRKLMDINFDLSEELYDLMLLYGSSWQLAKEMNVMNYNGKSAHLLQQSIEQKMLSSDRRPLLIMQEIHKMNKFIREEL